MAGTPPSPQAATAMAAAAMASAAMASTVMASTALASTAMLLMVAAAPTAAATAPKRLLLCRALPVDAHSCREEAHSCPEARRYRETANVPRRCVPHQLRLRLGAGRLLTTGRVPQ